MTVRVTIVTLSLLSVFGIRLPKFPSGFATCIRCAVIWRRLSEFKCCQRLHASRSLDSADNRISLKSMHHARLHVNKTKEGTEKEVATQLSEFNCTLGRSFMRLAISRWIIYLFIIIHIYDFYVFHCVCVSSPRSLLFVRRCCGSYDKIKRMFATLKRLWVCTAICAYVTNKATSSSQQK